MADELALQCRLSYTEGDITDFLELLPETFDVTGTRCLHNTMTVTTSALAIPIPAGTLGYGIFINRDATNYLELKTATGGVMFAKLKAGECAVFRFPSATTAPFAQANTASCTMEYMIVED